MPQPEVSKNLEDTLRRVLQDAVQRRQEYVTLELLLLGLLDDPQASGALRACGASADKLRADLDEFIATHGDRLPEHRADEQPEQTMGVQRVLQRAALHAISSDMKEIDGAHVLIQFFKETESHAAYFLERAGITALALKQYVSHGIAPGESEEEGTDEEDEEDGNQSPLEKYTTALVQMAAEGRIDPLIGRDMEIERTVQVLCRRKKNNPIYVGEPGVGKTALAEGLALRIFEGQVPRPLLDAEVYSLDMGALLAGTKFRGQFEQRIKGVLSQIQELPNAVLFIDEIHTIVGAGATSGGSMDASNLLKPALASGQLRCIGSTTHQEYKSSFDRDRALARRFQRIEVLEPTVEETVLILQGLVPKYESFHGVAYDADAVEAAARLAQKHIVDRHLPDKAIDVIDEAGAHRKMTHQGDGPSRITRTEVEQVVSRMARVPAETVSSEDKSQLRDLAERLKDVIYAQDEAIDSLVRTIKLSRAGLRTRDKPVGSFLFSGPTGVGKTEVSKQLARLLGVEFVRFDMSEYSERHSVSRLIGAPPGYVGFDQGGLLTDQVRRHPYSVVVLDEIEKAHPELFNILLQVMDRAKLTDNNGREADFRNVILVMTTNAGAQEMAANTIGFGQDGRRSMMHKAKSAMERTFSPEFRNRLDQWIVFHDLPSEAIERVAKKQVKLLEEQIRDRHVRIELSPEALAWLCEHGYQPGFGARPMARLVEQHISAPLSEEILFGELKDGGTVTVVLEGESLALRSAGGQ